MQVRFHLGMRCFQLISGRDGADKGRFRGGCVQMDAPGIQGFMEGGHRGLRSSGKSKRDPFDCVPPAAPEGGVEEKGRVTPLRMMVVGEVSRASCLFVGR